MLKAKCLERLREAQMQKTLEKWFRDQRMCLSVAKQWRPRGNIFKVDKAKGFILGSGHWTSIFAKLCSTDPQT